jgi:hypothetical protein
MARKLKIIVLLVTISLLTVVPAFARLTFAGGATTGSGSLVAEARVAGVGSDGGLVDVSLTLKNTQAPLVAMCQNKGGKQAPGQNPINVNLYQQQSLTLDSNGSGIAHFHVEYLPTAAEAGCPNDNWKVIDLLGYLQVTLKATNTTDGESAQLVLACYVEEANKVVDCTQISSSYTPPGS